MSQWRWFFSVMVLLGAGSVQADESALPPEAQVLAQKAAAVQSYRARFSMEAKEPDGQLFQLEGTLLYRTPNRRRMEMHKPGSKEEPQLLVSDGKTEWQYDPLGGMVYRILQPKEPPGPHRPFSEVQTGTVRFIGLDKDAEGEILRFEAKPIPESVDGAPVPVEKIRIELDGKTGLTRQITLLDAQGDPVMTQRFSELQINVSISEKEFMFVPRQGMAVVDLPAQKGE